MKRQNVAKQGLPLQNNDFPQQSDLRRGCEGYMMVIRYMPVDTIIMTMTVWTTPTLQSQEHALIMKNFMNTVTLPRLPEKLSILMHSFAGASVDRSIIYCQPFDQMKQMLVTICHKYKITCKIDAQHRVAVNYHPCRFFGTGIQIDNDVDFQHIFKNYETHIGVVSPKKRARIRKTTFREPT